MSAPKERMFNVVISGGNSQWNALYIWDLLEKVDSCRKVDRLVVPHMVSGMPTVASYWADFRKRSKYAYIKSGTTLLQHFKENDWLILHLPASYMTSGVNTLTDEVMQLVDPSCYAILALDDFPEMDVETLKSIIGEFKCSEAVSEDQSTSSMELVGLA